MKNLFLFLTLAFTMMAFASGFETSDLKQKEKVEFSQGFDLANFVDVSLHQDFVKDAGTHQFTSFELTSCESFGSFIRYSEQSEVAFLFVPIAKLPVKTGNYFKFINDPPVEIISSNHLILSQFSEEAFRLDGFVPWKA